MSNESVGEIARVSTIKENIDKLTECINENGRLIHDINKFLYNDDGITNKDSKSVVSLESAIRYLCDEVYMQREILYGIMNRLGVNPSDNVCAR